jgi:hypothetical protein
MRRIHFAAAVGIAALQANFLSAQVTLTPLPSFGTAGWLAPGSSAYLSTLNTERGLAYNTATGNLLLVSRQNVGGNGNNVRVLSGTTGADLGGLDPTGIAGGTFTVNMVGVDELGAIYVCNLSTSAAQNFKVYKWDSEATGLVTPPSVAYDAVSGVARTGDAFAVDGGLTGPIKFASAGSNNISASNFVVGALDGTNTSVPFLSVVGTAFGTNDYRLALTFIDGSNLIGTQGATARVTNFDPVTATATVTADTPLGGIARRAMDYTVINGRPLLAVMDTNSSIVYVLDMTDPTLPVTLVSATTTSGTLTANANGTASVAWGAVSGNSATLYAMASNQGVQAFQLTLAPAANVLTYGTGCDGLTLTSNSPSIGNLTFALDVGNVPVVSPLAFVAFGTTVVNPGIDLTAIGMAGCFSYTSFDLGLFAGGPTIGGVSSFPFPLPNDPLLAGASFATQGVSLSLATALNLAASNGLQFVVGF